MCLAQRQGLVQDPCRKVDVASSRGGACNQQAFTGDVEAALLQRPCSRELAQLDCVGLPVDQGGMGS